MATTASATQRDLCTTTLILAVVATALLLGPVAYHRLVSRMRQKNELVRAANVMAITGLAAVGLDVSAALALVLSYLAPGLPAVIITAAALALFAALWFAYPRAVAVVWAAAASCRQIRPPQRCRG